MTATTRTPGTPISYALLPDVDEPAWQIAAELTDGTIAVATDLPDLLSVLIDDYDTSTDRLEQIRPFQQRVEYAQRVITSRTAMYAAAVSGVGVSEDGASEPLPAAVVPTLVLAIDYAPYTDVPLPEGAAVIDPASDLSLLMSLHALGEVTVTVVT